jgi:hypothetical protein
MRIPAIALDVIATPTRAEPGVELGVCTGFSVPMGKPGAKWTSAMRIALGSSFVFCNAWAQHLRHGVSSK